MSRPSCGCPLDLSSQDLAGRHLDGSALGVGHVAHHHGRALEPGQEPQRGEVRHRHDIAVAVVPVGEPVSRERFHVHVDGEEIVTRLDAVFEHVVEEEPPRDAFSDRTTLHVGKRHHHRVDGSVGDASGQLTRVQHARTYSGVT